MLAMQAGDIWQFDLRSLYSKGISNHRVEHWLILEVIPGDQYAKMLEYATNYYGKDDAVVHYLCMETGQQSYKVFTHREWGTSKRNVDLYGNPYYKKVS